MKVGKNCNIHHTVQVFGSENLRIGNNVRIDAFTIITAGEKGVDIGDDVHIAAGCKLFGSHGRLVLERLVGLSANVCIYTGSDDYMRGYLHNPQVPDDLKLVHCDDVTLEEGALVGCGSVILPGVTIGRNASVGALAVVSQSIPPNAVVCNKKPTIHESIRNEALFNSMLSQFDERCLHE